MDFLTNYGLFLAKLLTIVVAIVATVASIIRLSHRHKEKPRPRIEVKKLNDRFDAMAQTMNDHILDEHELDIGGEKNVKDRLIQLLKRKSPPDESTLSSESKRRIFVIEFDGDPLASAASSLREETTAILTVATPKDEVFVRLNSAGGLVHTYGFAASQLLRIKNHDIPLTISVDKVAASGGYMMACVADRIIAAPFAVLGSIGVLAQLPNFHRFLKKHDIDFEQIMAGEYKRTLTVFGENTDSARDKFKQQIEDIHTLFKDFVSEHRPQLDITKISTGEYWLGKRALSMHLVDELRTSDDFLLEQSKDANIYQVTYAIKKSLGERLSSRMGAWVGKVYDRH